MNKPHLQASLLCLIFFAINVQFLSAQDFRSFNQNASRSNHTRVLSISFAPVYSNPLNNRNDSLLFRGSGGGFRVGADYFFGNAGIGFVSGFGTSSPDNATINAFLKRGSVPLDQIQITKAKQQNMYLLVGPSVKFGKTVALYAHAKGGLFINNSGLVSIQQKGAVRAIYRNESTSKSIYPGFMTGFNVQYSTKSDVWSFGVGADYMNTKAEVNNYDGRRNGGIEPLKLSRSISDVVTGITIRYNIGSAREASRGMATGRVLPTVNKREILLSKLSSNGLETGRVLPTVNKIETNNPESCGQVITRTTNPDGTVDEMTFACPKDAVAYAKKTKRDQNLWSPANFRTTADGDHSNGIISGRLSWMSSNSTTGIFTNKSTDRGGSTTLNSQSSSTRQTNQSSFGTMVRLSAREASSGMATGKREASSGMATGKKEYEPIFSEGENGICNPCMADVKSNPLYTGKMSGAQNNPLYQGKERTINNGTDADGIADINVFLIEANSEAVIAKTQTEQSGDFFFANVPEGNYIVKVAGMYEGKKGYDVFLKSKTDLAGSIEQDINPIQLTINSGKAIDGMMQKAGISTSRSNIRTKSVSIVDADENGIWSPRSNYKIFKTKTGDVDGDGKSELLVGGMLPGGGIISAVMSPGDPVHGVDVKLGKNSGGVPTTTITNDNGEFEFKNLDAGDYFITVNQNIIINDETIVSVWGDPHENINTSESNVYNDAIKKNENTATNQKSNSVVLNGGDNKVLKSEDIVKAITFRWTPLVPKPKEPVTYRLRVWQLMQGQNGTQAMRSNNPVVEKTITNTGETTVQGILTGPCKPPYLCDFIWSVQAINSNGNVINNGIAGQGSFNVERPDNNDANSVTINTDDNKILNAEEATKAITFRWTPLVPKPKEPVTYRLRVWQLMQGQNGTQAMRSNNPVVEKSITNTEETIVQGILTGPCKPPYLCDFIWDVQALGSDGKLINNEAVRQGTFSVAQPDNNDANGIAIDESGPSKPKRKPAKLNVGPVKWMAPESMEKTINTSYNNIDNMLSSLDALEQQLDADQSAAKNIINANRSNIKSQRTRINELEQTLNTIQQKNKNAAMADLEQKRNETDLQFLKLQLSIKELGANYNSISGILKTSHDIAMNSIRNLK